MRPVAPERPGGTGVGGGRGSPAAPLLLLCLGLLRPAAACPPDCLCASDIVSCSGRNLSAPPPDLPGYATRLDLSHNALAALPAGWLARRFDRLATLVLGRNRVGRIDGGAFAPAPRLAHLDLSSNKLAALNSSVFAGLRELRELLLFGNQIAEVSPDSFRDLYSLQRLYLSGNKLAAFPLELYQEPDGPRNLTFLDLSNNRLSAVPVQSLLSLSQHGGIYLQENPLVCDCALLALLEYWTWKRYRPLADFRAEYPCGDGAGAGTACKQQGTPEGPLEARSYQVDPGKWLRVPCPGLTLPLREGQVAFWVTPTLVMNSSADHPSAHLAVLSNGTLEIRGALTEDSGTYACAAARGRHVSPGESLEVAVVVGNHSSGASSGLAHRGSAEHFNTAFTTLASCVVSIILVLLYLYLTPCRCRDGGGSRGCGGRAIILCSDPREAETGQRRPNGKRVAFMEPQAEESRVADPKTPAISLGQVTTEGILKNGSRTVEPPVTDASQKV